jgi:crossover junction endodeoxyribonuclease RuvC
MSEITIIGIDPGKHGGIAIVNDDFVRVIPIPLAGDDVDLAGIHTWLCEYVPFSRKHNTVIAYIEKVGAMPKQGVTSMFSFGFTTGALHGIVAAMMIPRFMVTPQAWKKEILVGTAKDKNSAIEYCRRVYPNVSLMATDRSKTCHDGMADALCIACFGVLQHGNI